MAKMGIQHKKWTTMLFLMTTLLITPVKTIDNYKLQHNKDLNENYNTSDFSETLNTQNILTYSKTNKEKESYPNINAEHTLINKVIEREKLLSNTTINEKRNNLMTQVKHKYEEEITQTSNNEFEENGTKNTLQDNDTKTHKIKAKVGKSVENLNLLRLSDTIEEKENNMILEIRQRELDEALEYGFKAMLELYEVKEPQWYRMGLYLDKSDPAYRVAAFGAPNKRSSELSKFGYAALEASKRIAESYPENVSRVGFPKAFSSRLRTDECPLSGKPRCAPASRRYRTADGTCNNLKHPWRGSAMLPMQRFLPPMYEDGIQSIRRSVFGSRLPSARDVSIRVHRDRNHEIQTVTLMFMQWGQFIDHDITSMVKSRSFNGTTPRCCDRGGLRTLPSELTHPACLPIEVSEDDWFLGKFGIRCLEFIRSAPSTRIDCDLGWREQINQATPYIDASTIYGSDIETSDSIRTFRNGKLIYGRPLGQGPLQPPDPPGGELCRSGALSTDCFQAGDGRAGEQPALTAMHTMFLRYHNKIATILSQLNSHWSDEKVYQETRKILAAIVQHITYREFLPLVLGQEVIELFELNLVRKGYYNKYNDRINSAIANSFSTAAFRFGHSMVQNTYMRYDSKHRPIPNNVTLHEDLDNFENIFSFGSIDRLLLGLCNQPSQRRDEFMSGELTNHLFQTSGTPFGIDLAAINIQRGRDHGIPPYTSWRQPCGLSLIKDWSDLYEIMSRETAQRFKSLYRHVDDIDLFSGGLAEKPVRGGIVGPTFACIIAQQFLNLRKGDRFWYENGGFVSSFTPAQLQQIKHVTLSQVICQTMNDIETIQPFVFLSSDSFRNVRISCRSSKINNFDLQPWEEKNFNDVDNKLDFDHKIQKRTHDLKLNLEGNIGSSRGNRIAHNLESTSRKPRTTSQMKRSRNPTRQKNTKTKNSTQSLKIPVTKVTVDTVKLGNKELNAFNPIPQKPTFTNYVQRPVHLQHITEKPDVTYMIGRVQKTTPLSTSPTQTPLEVNIKIQYYLPTTVKPTNSKTKPKKKRPSRPTYSYDEHHIITKRPTETSTVSYPVFVQQLNYNAATTKRPSNGYFDDMTTYKPYRPTYAYFNPIDSYETNNYYNKPSDYSDAYNKPADPYNSDEYLNRPLQSLSGYNGDTVSKKKPYTIKPIIYYDNLDQNRYQETQYENRPFSTSQRPYIYTPDNHYIYNKYSSTQRPFYSQRPAHSNYDYEQTTKYPAYLYSYNNDKNKYRPSQSSYNRDDPIDQAYSEILDNDRTTYGSSPKKPTFGQLDDKIDNPAYSIGYVQKLDNVQDKLDFKTRFIYDRRATYTDDSSFVKISSAKKVENIDGIESKEEEFDLDGPEENDNWKSDQIEVVYIDVTPSEARNDLWVVYNATEEEMPLLEIPEINLNVSCTDEVPLPMNVTINSDKFKGRLLKT